MFNKKDFIYHKRSAYSQEGCNHAINFFEQMVDWQVEGTLGGLPATSETMKMKKCTEMYLKREEYSIFDDVLGDGLQEYHKIYPYINDKCSAYNLAPIFKLQKYKPKEGYFELHCENEGPNRGYERILAWMIYLNDVTEGGHTRFPNQNMKFQPRRGDLLIWPAYFTHTHYGIVSKTQTKYIATGWFTFNNT